MIDELGVSLWHRWHERAGIKTGKAILCWRSMARYRQGSKDNAKKTKVLKDQIEEFEGLKSRIEDLEVLIELSIEEEDYDVYSEIREDFKKSI